MSQPISHDADPRLPALLAWRQQLIASGAVSATSFKEAHLRMVLRSGRTEVEQIAAMLPGWVAQHADQMARVLAVASAEVGGPGDEATGDEAAADEAAAGPEPEKTVMIGVTGAPRPQTGQRAGDETVIPPDAFAPFTLAEQTGHPAALALRRGDGGALQVIWPAYAAPFVAYRLVSAEDNRPYSPDRAHLVVATTATSTLDERPAAGAVRHLQVWVNAGASRAEALAAQPVLHAAGVEVATVTDMTVREDSGRVIGQWSVFPGVRGVHVYRVPVEQAAAGGPQHRILAGDDNRGGFIDAGAERGRRYLYRARCEVIVDGVARLSEAVQVHVAVPAVLVPVTDLTLRMHPTDPVSFDLSWTPPPAGRVVIFRTQGGPGAGAEAVELPEAALEQAGLHAELRLTHPAAERRNRQGRPTAVMADVPWPAQWSRAYFTPVTILGGRARLGATTSSVRTGLIRDAELAEHCNKQVLTLAWPEGAASVVVYLAPKGHDPRAGLSGRSYEISLEDYEKFGGILFTGQLPVGGCSLHLAPVAFSAGRRVLGAITTITYDGLLRVWYSVHINRDPAGVPLTAALAVRAEVDAMKGSPPFRLVHRPDRIPLSVNDGEALDVAPLTPSGEIAAPPAKVMQFSSLGTSGGGEVWLGDVRGRTGWIRLLADLGDPRRLRRLALLDPPVGALRLTGGPS